MKYFPIYFALLILLVTRLFVFYQDRHVYKNGDTFHEAYNFSQEPKKNSYGQYFFVNNILVSVPSFPLYQYGDNVMITGVVTEEKSNKGTLLMVQNPEIKPLQNRNPFLAVSKFVRQKVENAVLGVLPAKEGGLLLGILLGVRDKIDPVYYDQLKSVGILHVIAASGQNVSIVASILLVFFSKFVKIRMAILFTSLGILFYALLTGFDPPIVRAAIMAIISYGALLWGRQSSGIFALFATGFIMVFIAPSLLTDISFQLSFLSTFGILVIKPLMDGLINFGILGIIKDDITTTLSSQIITFPLMLSVFGAYSWLSFPVNILILWTVPFIMIFGGIGAIISLVSSFLAQPFILLSFPFLLYFNFIVGIGAKFQIFLSFSSFPLSILIGYYIVLGAVLFKVYKK
jgi:competence protein ComEC